MDPFAKCIILQLLQDTSSIPACLSSIQHPPLPLALQQTPTGLSPQVHGLHIDDTADLVTLIQDPTPDPNLPSDETILDSPETSNDTLDFYHTH